MNTVKPMSDTNSVDGNIEMSLIQPIKQDPTTDKKEEIEDALGAPNICAHNLFKKAREENTDEYDDMMASCNKENMDLKHLRSSQNDPTSALILVQGHWTLHLAMFLTSLLA